MKKLFLISTAVVLTISMVAVGCPAPDDDTIVLTFGSAFPAGPPAPISIGIEWWQNEVVERTGGRVQFENYWGGALFDPPAVLDAIENRITDIVHYAYVWVPGKTPLGTFMFAVPFRPSDPYVHIQIQRTIFDEFPAFDEEMAAYNGKILFLQSIMDYDATSNLPIATLDDFAGQKLAVIGLYFPDYVAASNATPVTVPIGDRYTEFQVGTLDGQVVTLDLAHGPKHYEVQQYYTFIGLGSAISGPVVINTDAWQELPVDIQNIMLEVGREAELWHATKLNDTREIMLEVWEDYGVIFNTMSEVDKTRWKEAMPDTAGNFSAAMDALGYPGSEIIARYYELAEDAGHVWP